MPHVAARMAGRDEDAGRYQRIPLVRDASGGLLGAVGISGDTSDNDESAALGGITVADLEAETG